MEEGSNKGSTITARERMEREGRNGNTGGLERRIGDRNAPKTQEYREEQGWSEEPGMKPRTCRDGEIDQVGRKVRGVNNVEKDQKGKKSKQDGQKKQNFI